MAKTPRNSNVESQRRETIGSPRWMGELSGGLSAGVGGGKVVGVEQERREDSDRKGESCYPGMLRLKKNNNGLESGERGGQKNRKRVKESGGWKKRRAKKFTHSLCRQGSTGLQRGYGFTVSPNRKRLAGKMGGKREVSTAMKKRVRGIARH